jgi:hypothetical protein
LVLEGVEMAAPTNGSSRPEPVAADARVNRLLAELIDAASIIREAAEVAECGDFDKEAEGLRVHARHIELLVANELRSLGGEQR